MRCQARDWVSGSFDLSATATSFAFFSHVSARQSTVVSICSVLEYYLLTNAVVTVGVLLHTLCCSFLNQDYHVVTVPLCFVSLSLEKV